MRHILLSCVILLLALSFCLFSMLHIREICAQTLSALTSAQEQAQVYNFEACRASVQQALRIWRQYERYLGLTLTHDAVDDILERFAALSQYAILEDRDDFLAGCAELRFSIEHIRQMELPSIENIL